MDNDLSMHQFVPSSRSAKTVAKQRASSAKDFKKSEEDLALFQSDSEHLSAVGLEIALVHAKDQVQQCQQDPLFQ